MWNQRAHSSSKDGVIWVVVFFSSFIKKKRVIQIRSLHNQNVWSATRTLAVDRVTGRCAWLHSWKRDGKYNWFSNWIIVLCIELNAKQYLFFSFVCLFVVLYFNHSELIWWNCARSHRLYVLFMYHLLSCWSRCEE